MGMTRQDYEMVAEAIERDRAVTETSAGRKAIDDVAEGLARRLKNAYDNFDRERFLLAAGWGE